MTFLHAIILGIVEGITEFLPVSSTAHLEFTSRLLGISQSEFASSFVIAIQAGAILAVIWLYRQKLFMSRAAFLRIVVGFIPTGIIGFILYKVIKSFLIGNVWIGALMLAVGGIVMLLVEGHVAGKDRSLSGAKSIEDLSYGTMAALGVIQALAVVPGVSRSGALIVGGLLMKIPRAVIVETAFLLAVPTMLAATGYDLLKTGVTFSGNEWALIGVGALVSAVVAYGVARWLLAYIKRETFVPFAWYRILVGIALMILFFVI